MRSISKNRGFTLFELMVVAAIIGILAMIALPNYTDYLTKSRLAEAISTLSDMRVKMERHFQDNRSYAGACVAGTQAPLPQATANFQFACSNLAGGTYTVTATGLGSMTGFVLTINQDNLRRTLGVGSGWTVPNPDTCWVRNKTGTC